MSTHDPQMIAKAAAARRAVDLIEQGMTVGLGSGTTSNQAIQLIGDRVAGGLRIKAVATSLKSESLARKFGIDVVEPSASESIDLAIDGADEIDKKGNLIKGGGGSLLREKIIAFASKRFYVMADLTKLEEKLGKRAVPVEVIPFAAPFTLRHIITLGCRAEFRKVNEQTFVTDNGNVIIDCHFHTIEDPAWLDVKLKMIPGVIETGLFLNKIVSGICIGEASGESRLISLDG